MCHQKNQKILSKNLYLKKKNELQYKSKNNLGLYKENNK